MVSRCRNYIFAFLFLVFMPCFALPPAVHHPLDSMTPEEYWKVYNTLQDAGKLGEKTIFSSILLQEPNKSDVLAWKPGKPFTRKADAVLLTEGKSYEATVNITTGKLESYVELKKDQAPLTEAEMHGYDDVLKKDERLPPGNRRNLPRS